MIGIVGGVGPYAGLDLLRKVFDNTMAEQDQDHVDALLFSEPSGILDRTEYLIGNVKENPGFAIAKVLIRLEKAGATVAGIPCNTAHVNSIFNVMLHELQIQGSHIEVLNMIEQTISYIGLAYTGIRKIGVLSTTGTYLNGLYADALKLAGYEALIPDQKLQDQLIHPAIYDPEYGIKTHSNPLHPLAIENLQKGISFLKNKGAEGVILGCTEIPLALPGLAMNGMVAIDPTTALARSLIRQAFPEKLKPLN